MKMYPLVRSCLVRNQKSCRPSEGRALRRAVPAGGVWMVGAATCLLAGALFGQTIPNPSFEADTFTVWPGYISGNAPITGWSANANNRVGLNCVGSCWSPANTSPFANNGVIPDGQNVAFIQSDAAVTGGVTLSTTISGLTSGQFYKLSFRCNARGGQAPILKVEVDGNPILGATVASVGGSNPYKYCVVDFMAAGNTANLTLRNDFGGDTTVCVDDFRIAARNSGWSYAAWTDDSSSGVDGSKTYTHAYNFGSSANATINGITFTGKAGGNPAQSGSFSTASLPNVFNNDTNNLSVGTSGGSRTLAYDFCYGPGGNTVVETLNINGLFPGGEYLATIYSVGWENGPVRAATFGALATRLGEDRLTVNQDTFGNNNGIRVSYHFVAASDTLSIIYEPLQAATFHTYGFSVQQISLPSAPTIGLQPVSQCRGAGDTVTFTVTAGGSQPLYYQWRKDGSYLADGANVSGSSSNILTLSNVTTAFAGGYSVIVSNNTTMTVTSVVATLQVGLAIVNASFEADTFATYPGYVSGNGPITGWNALANHGINPGTTFSPFADNGAIPDGSKVAFMQQDGALSQMISGFTPGNAYYVVYYENARNTATPAIEVQIGDTPIVAAHDRPPVGGANPYVKMTSDVFVADAGTLQLTFIKSNPHGGDSTALIDYVCVLPMPDGTPPTITQQPQSQIAQAGGTVTLTVTAFGSPPFTYQWSKNGTNIDGATQRNLTFSPVSKDDEGHYRVAVTGVGSATSAEAVLTVFEPIADLFSTGVQADRSALADGSVDAHYQIIVNPDTGSPDAIVEDSTQFPIVAGPWLANTASSKWIGPRFNTAASAGPADYTYRTTINLTDRDPSTVVILGQWAVDNTGVDIQVNGVTTANPQSSGFDHYTSFAISNGVNATFVAGTNNIDFLVRNEVAAGYTGLRVEILQSNVRIPPGIPPSITGQPISRKAVVGDTVTFNVAATGSQPLSYQWSRNGVALQGKTSATLTLMNVSNSDIGLYTVNVSNPSGNLDSAPASLCLPYRRVAGVVFGTGVDDAGALVANGSTDLHYILAASGDTNFPGPDAIVVEDAGFPIGTGPWVANGPKSKWIGPQTYQTNGNAAGNYTYQTFFDLTGYDPSQVRIAGQWAVDNTGTDLLVNGVSTGIMSPGFGGFTPFLISSGLQAGLNQFDFQMNNSGTDVSPTGLRVDLELQVANQATMTITHAGNIVTLTWTPTSPCQQLYASDNLAQPSSWHGLVNVQSGYSFDIDDPNSVRFFKIVEH